MESTKNDHDSIKTSERPEEYIIAIGASAGGMEAINVLFDNTPSDAVSYVIVQHLSPDHKSLMAELLAKHSKLKIYSVENGIEVLPNCVYVLPEGKNMTISGGKLFLKNRESSTPNSVIDIFLNSLAEDQGSQSIAIILSGNGSDGTKGIEAIKKVGGMVIVQDPESTEYNSMPHNAIESGNYDLILTPEQIPLQIENYVKQRTWMKNLSDPDSKDSKEALLEVINLIKNHTPLDFSEYKRPTIIRRMIKRMMATNTNTINDYIELLKTNSSEIEILSKEFLISVTKFFRDPEAFEVIATKVIPEIIENKLLVDTLKIWVIGCASGEEAYSLAILIKEHLIDIKKDMEVKIFATDIDKDALAIASRGYYTNSILKDVSEERLKAFFIKEGDHYKIKENIRKMIVFAEHDIAHQPPYAKIDFISCRNLLIYFNPTLQKKIFSTLHYCLNLGGYLFLGPSEGIGELKNMFQEMDRKWKIYKNIEIKNKLNFNSYNPRNLYFKLPPSSSNISKSSKISLPDNLSMLMNQFLLEEADYIAGACIDENNDVVLPLGNLEKYLSPKLFNNNLLDLLPLELSVAAATSIKSALNDNATVKVKNINYIENKTNRCVSIVVKPLLNESKSFQKVVILLLGEEEIEKSNNKVEEVYEKDLFAARYLSHLEQELAETKEKLTLSDESLIESNNHIQSYNEELLSGNEELQSSNEELQSTNEELTTLNSEYHLKIKELAELNDDLDNYFRSTHNSQLYVDKNLIIRKFNPVAMQQINIKESDIGRPLADISTNIKFSSLIEDISEVITTQANKEKHIQTTDGKWYSMMIVPYIRSQDKKSNGAIINFHDITDITRSKKIIEETNRRLLKIVEDHDTFIYSASHDLKAPLNNMEGLLSILQNSKNLIDIKAVTIPLIKSVIRLKETIEELSHITKIEDETENIEKVNLEVLLDEVKLSINSSILKSNAKLNIDLEEKEIKFSKKNLRSILLNLLSNSIKYRSKDHPLEVDIKTRRKEGSIVLSFQDNGIGISKDKIGQVFTKFKRLHDNETDEEGSGIGLFLIKKIITNAGGEIEVNSIRGKGSCFTVYFRD